ncbi:MAG: hypothetical protein V4689_20825 [Verrucomicrobiota bacterium]
MKIPSPLCLAASLLFSAPVLTSQEASPAIATPAPEVSYPNFLNKSGIQILSATYGSGVHFSDVTDEAIKLLNQQSRFYACPEWLRADPTPGWNKALVIVFKHQDKRYLFSCGEGGKVDVPLLKLKIAESDVAAAP